MCAGADTTWLGAPWDEAETHGGACLTIALHNPDIGKARHLQRLEPLFHNERGVVTIELLRLIDFIQEQMKIAMPDEPARKIHGNERLVVGI